MPHCTVREVSFGSRSSDRGLLKIGSWIFANEQMMSSAGQPERTIVHFFESRYAKGGAVELASLVQLQW